MWSKEKVMIYCAGFAVVWSVLLSMFYLQITTFPHIWQFVMVTSVLYALPSIVFGQLMMNHRGWVKYTMGAFLLITAFDLLAPPLAVGFDGVINASSTLAGAAPDVVLGEFFAGLGANGVMLWVATYPASFIVLIASATFLLTERQLWEIISKR